MGTIIQLLLGALACAMFVMVVRPAGLRRELIIYAAALVLAAFIYVGFAVVGGATLGWTALELGGLALFSLPALLGVRGGGPALALGWAAHAAWDVLIHGVWPAGFVPGWYPGVCAGFDVALAGYVALRFRERRAYLSRASAEPPTGERLSD